MKVAPFKLERFFARYEFTAPYLLCPSDCEALTLDEVLALEAGALQRLTALRLGYVEATGAPEVRAGVAALFDRVSADEVLLHAGSSEAIFAFMSCALEAGDHVIVQFPCYQSHYEIAKSIGCAVTPWVGDEGQGWELDVDFLKREIRANTKAVMLTAPHNPTGYLMGRSTFASVVEVVRERGIWLFSDEIFRFIEQQPAERLRCTVDVYERAISVGGVSKTFGLPGARVGWAVAQDRALLARMSSLKDYMSLCNGAVDEFLAGIALRNHETLRRRSLEIIIANLRVLDEFFGRHADLFQWQRPRAGSVGLVRFLGAGGTAKFCDDVVRECGVMLLPSAEFDFGDAHFRVGFGRRNLPEAVDRLEAYLRSRKAALLAKG